MTGKEGTLSRSFCGQMPDTELAMVSLRFFPKACLEPNRVDKTHQEGEQLIGTDVSRSGEGRVEQGRVCRQFSKAFLFRLLRLHVGCIRRPRLCSAHYSPDRCPFGRREMSDGRTALC